MDSTKIQLVKRIKPDLQKYIYIQNPEKSFFLWGLELTLIRYTSEPKIWHKKCPNGLNFFKFFWFFNFIFSNEAIINMKKKMNKDRNTVKIIYCAKILKNAK